MLRNHHEKPILKENLMEVANKTCKSNPNCNNCSECMKGSPYRFCCKDECGEHEFCRGCAYRDRKQIREFIQEMRWKVGNFINSDYNLISPLAYRNCYIHSHK